MAKWLSAIGGGSMDDNNNSGRNVEIVTDGNGKKLVRINEILFKGKRSIDWNDCEGKSECGSGNTGIDRNSAG